MLHRYAFSNFQSFLETTEVSLKLSKKVPSLGWEATSPSGQRLSSVVMVVGPNSSGKTSLIKPLVFVSWFVRSSFHAKPDDPIPVMGHFAARGAPTDFEVEAEDRQGQLWRYVLSVTPERVLHEALYKKRDRFVYTFIRDWDADKKEYVIKQQDFGLAPGEAKKVRPNASLISTAAQYGVPLALDLVNLNVQTNIASTGKMPYVANEALPRAAKSFVEDKELREHMVRLLRRWDLGLSDVRLHEFNVPDASGKTVKQVWPLGVHIDRQGKEQALIFIDESSGTQSAFVLLARLLPVLTQGGLAVIDEFESDLHPHMLEAILELFADPKTNPHKGQLVFTCHATQVLNLLHKSQVMLVEKDKQCESSAWRMDSVDGIRTDDNYYSKYMAGAYGAVPEL